MKVKAYHSDPDWNRSFVGRWIWIYRGKGILELTEDTLIYDSVPFRLQLLRNQIHSVNLGTFPRTAKPIRLNFLDIEFTDDDKVVQHVYLVPLIEGKSPWLTPVWKTNENVKIWLDALNEWRDKQGALLNG